MNKRMITIGLMLLAFFLVGCSKKNEEITSFIPTIIPTITPTPTEIEEDTVNGEEEDSESQDELKEPVKKYVKLNEFDAILNVRSKPSLEGAVVGFLVHTEEIEVEGFVDGWARFQMGNQTCYVKDDFLVDEMPDYIEPPTATPTPTPTPTEAPTPTIEPTPTEVPTATPKPTEAPKPTAVPTVAPTATPTPTKKPEIDKSKTSLRVFKSERKLELWNNNKLVNTYPIGLGFSPKGDKTEENDGKTPEGTYYLTSKNDNSTYYKSFGISYPNAEDALEAYDQNRISEKEKNKVIEAITSGKTPPKNTPLGGNVMLQGNGSHSDWTTGSIAVNNEVMDVLWDYCSTGTSIVIYQ